MIDDSDIQQAVERLERELQELRRGLLEIQRDVSRMHVLLETLVEEAQRTNALLERP